MFLGNFYKNFNSLFDCLMHVHWMLVAIIIILKEQEQHGQIIIHLAFAVHRAIWADHYVNGYGGN